MSHRREREASRPSLWDDPDFLRGLVERTVRAVGRTGYRNGTKLRPLTTRVGTPHLAVPQDRDGAFSTELFARYQHSEQALVSTLLERSVPGVSTRKEAAIIEARCGTSRSKSQGSALTSRLDGDPRGIFAAGTRSQAVAAAGVVAERWERSEEEVSGRHYLDMTLRAVTENQAITPLAVAD